MRKNFSHRQSRKKCNPSETRPNLLVTEIDMILKSDKHAETLCKKTAKKQHFFIIVHWFCNSVP